MSKSMRLTDALLTVTMANLGLLFEGERIVRERRRDIRFIDTPKALSKRAKRRARGRRNAA
jgi:hypothetical protein